MSKEDSNARRLASGVFRSGLSVISVGVSLSITLLLVEYTFRTPLFFPAIEALARQADPLEQTHNDPSFEGWKSLAAIVRLH